MIKEIENKKLKISFDDSFKSLNSDLQAKIDSFWNEIQKDESYLWNGEILNVDKVELGKDLINVTCNKTNYAHYLYDSRVGIVDEASKCIAFWAGIIPITSDGYYIVGVMSDETASPNRLQIPGGNIDINDLINNEVSIVSSIKREFYEEVGIDLNNNDLVKDYSLKYLELPEDKRNACGMIFETNLNISKNDFEKQYLHYVNALRKNNGEVEFKNVVFIDKSNPIKGLKKLESLNHNDTHKYFYEIFNIESSK